MQVNQKPLGVVEMNTGNRFRYEMFLTSLGCQLVQRIQAEVSFTDSTQHPTGPRHWRACYFTELSD